MRDPAGDPALTALAFGTVGVTCGEDGGGGSVGESSSVEGEEYVDALVAASTDEPVTAEDMECYARSFVDAVGVDVLQGAGVTPEDMSNPDAERLRHHLRRRPGGRVLG